MDIFEIILFALIVLFIILIACFLLSLFSYLKKKSVQKADDEAQDVLRILRKFRILVILVMVLIAVCYALLVITAK